MMIFTDFANGSGRAFGSEYEGQIVRLAEHALLFVSKHSPLRRTIVESNSIMLLCQLSSLHQEAVEEFSK